MTLVEPESTTSPVKSAFSSRQVVAEVIGRVAGRGDGHQRDAVAFDHVAVADVVDVLRQVLVAMDPLRDGQPGESRAEVLDAAEMVLVPMREQHA